MCSTTDGGSNTQNVVAIMKNIKSVVLKANDTMADIANHKGIKVLRKLAVS